VMSVCRMDESCSVTHSANAYAQPQTVQSCGLSCWQLQAARSVACLQVLSSRQHRVNEWSRNPLGGSNFTHLALTVMCHCRVSKAHRCHLVDEEVGWCPGLFVALPFSMLLHQPPSCACVSCMMCLPAFCPRTVRWPLTLVTASLVTGRVCATICGRSFAAASV
jgi:hypothetical protein